MPSTTNVIDYRAFEHCANLRTALFTGNAPAVPATLQGDTLGMTFYSASPGLTYRVEASADLAHWSTDGITQTALNRDGMSTATVPRGGPAQFLRLAVSR